MDKFITLKRREPLSIDALIDECIKEMKLESGLDDLRIYEAWDRVSGAAGYTMDKYFRGGTLCVSISSSVVRSMLLARRSQLLRELNIFLENEARSGGGKILKVDKLVFR